MELTNYLLNLALIGVDPVLYILILMSVISIAVILDRFFTYRYLQKRLFEIDTFDLEVLLDKRLGILASFGSNAPYIGLFGTVLGIIRAFHDLANAEFGVKTVMIGISQSLVSTAMGLFVAIPAVFAYNYFVRKMRFLLSLKEKHSSERSF